MTDKAKSTNAARLLYDLDHNEELRHQAVEGQALDPQLVLLRQWQADRLSQTYADFLADKRYSPACLFFLNDIYAVRDFTQRDHDIERIYSFLSRLMPDYVLQLLVDTIKLNNLTNALDQAMLRALVDKLGVTSTITPSLYAEGYRVCDNYGERAHQIKLIAEIVKQVDKGARVPGVGLAIRLARGPAHRAGWTEMYDSLERGYAAFRQTRELKAFVRAIEQREMHILDRIFAGDPNPFDVKGL